IPVSIDTYKGNVAEAALAAGADLVNDIWGLKHDDKIAKVISKYGVPCCLMHNRSHVEYVDFLADVKADLEQSLRLAKGAGIAADQIILDPGVGFAKSCEQNLQIIKNMSYFKELGFPMLLGTSRKSVIGLTLALPVEERVEGTLVTTVLAVQAGYSFVRVHDIKENVRAIQMLYALTDGRLDDGLH
ncbi:MAG TPA: dihydropteroate synthase, partial [Lachnospiraceae bacterium]|nr:dihydropteroate synthase [Lachnospiraceae bacterium]